MAVVVHPSCLRGGKGEIKNARGELGQCTMMMVAAAAAIRRDRDGAGATRRRTKPS